MKVSTKKYVIRKIKLIYDVHAHRFNVLHIHLHYAPIATG